MDTMQLSNVQNFIQISPTIILRFFLESFSNFTLHLALKCGTVPQVFVFPDLDFGLSVSSS